LEAALNVFVSEAITLDFSHQQIVDAVEKRLEQIAAIQK